MLPHVTACHVQGFQEVPNMFDMLLPSFLEPVEGELVPLQLLCTWLKVFDIFGSQSCASEHSLSPMQDLIMGPQLSCWSP